MNVYTHTNRYRWLYSNSEAETPVIISVKHSFEKIVWPFVGCGVILLYSVGSQES